MCLVTRALQAGLGGLRVQRVWAESDLPEGSPRGQPALCHQAGPCSLHPQLCPLALGVPWRGGRGACMVGVPRVHRVPFPGRPSGAALWVSQLSAGSGPASGRGPGNSQHNPCRSLTGA